MNITKIFDSLSYGPAPEAADMANAWLESRKRKMDLFIGGEWCAPMSRKYFETLNPGTGKPIAEIAFGESGDVDKAVKAAKTALPLWQGRSCEERARKMYALARLVQRHARLLAVLETMDNGKPIRETRDIDLPLVARHFYHHAGWAQLLNEDFARFEPVGVVGQIIPWNFPLLMLAWKVAPALATGCTVVLKPAEFTSITAIAFADLCMQAGIPPGVVNIVTGDGSTGEAIVEHREVQKIAFTGSTEVGRRIRSITAGSGKALTLELGGKSPFIIFDDADIDSAVEGIVDAIWFNQGQVCCAGSRLLLQENIFHHLVEKLKRRMEALRVGDPLDKAVDIGAIVAPVQLQRIERLVKQGVEEGAQVWQPPWAKPSEGWFYPPTLITDAGPASTVSQVEIFGPVIVAMPFRTPTDAVLLANNTRYGLAASVWTENINLALDMAPQLKAGVVWINSTNLFDASAGFGGYRESGFGREGGREGIFAYLRPTFLRNLVTYDNEPLKPIEPIMLQSEPAKTEIMRIDRTVKQYIDGKQTRSDSGYTRPVFDASGKLIGDVSDGNRKDIRDAVEAASKATSWTKMSGHNRAQVLYFIGENLEVRSLEFRERISLMTGRSPDDAAKEVGTSIDRLFYYAAWADKYDGNIHLTSTTNITLAMNEPIGIVGIACPNEMPLLAFISLVAPAIAVGNRVVAIPSPTAPLSATDLYQVLDTSDVPDGAVNIITGEREVLAQTLAEHDSVEAIWYVGPRLGSNKIETASTGNMKQTWVNNGLVYDWLDKEQGQGEQFLRHATQVKNIWVPYGE